MTGATPAQDFMCEVADLAGFIDDVLAMPRGSRWHWPSYYLFYAEVDRLQGLLMRTRWLFEPPCASLGQPSTAQEGAESANELFAQLGQRQQAVVDWLSQMWRNTRTGTERTAAHERMEAHFHPKSGWNQLFRKRHCTGRMSADGAMLERAVLGIDADSSRDHIPYSSAECMIRYQLFDLGAPGTKQVLVHAVEHARKRIGQTFAAVGMLLVGHCTIEDLLPPRHANSYPR
jgi:hypothetical protein